MNTYFMEWYDREAEKMTTIKINEAQTKLMNYIFLNQGI